MKFKKEIYNIEIVLLVPEIIDFCTIHPIEWQENEVRNEPLAIKKKVNCTVAFEIEKLLFQLHHHAIRTEVWIQTKAPVQTHNCKL